MARVVLKNITKIYNDHFKAVDQVSIHIKDREFLILLGPSGCGKSTILRMIAGLEKITSGELLIDGKVMNDVRPKDRRIAMVFQNYALYPHMTVRQNLSFGLRLNKVPEKELKKRVTDVAETLRIKNLLEKKPKHLSGGQRQRVALGRAIIRKPNVFLFDEPLSNLDAKLRIHMRAEILALHRRLKSTAVYVTHDQVEAMTLGDKIVLMKEGVIQQQGPPLQLYNHPENTFVAGFIGSPSMNMFKARVSGDIDALILSNAFFHLEMRDHRFLKLKDYINQSVMVGIRPEHITPTHQKMDHNRIHGVIQMIEHMGDESFIFFSQPISEPKGESGSEPTPETDPQVAKIQADTPLFVGDTVNATVNTDKVHIFDLITQTAIL